MKVQITIDCVDGETQMQKEFTDLPSAWQWLTDHDHEGSCLGLKIESENSEEVYKILD